MRRTTRTIGFLTLGLAMAATACRSTPAHADGLTAAKSETPKGEAASGGGGAFGTTGGGEARVEPGTAAIVAPQRRLNPAAPFNGHMAAVPEYRLRSSAAPRFSWGLKQHSHAGF